MIKDKKKRKNKKDYSSSNNSKLNTFPASKSGDLLSKHTIELNLQACGNSNPSKPSQSNIWGRSSSTSTSSTDLRASPTTTYRKAKRKNTLHSEATLNGKRKRLLTKTLPKTGDGDYSSSSYYPSRGRVIYEEFFESDMAETSSSLSSRTTGRRPKGERLEVQMEPETSSARVIGIKNVNYDASKFSGAEEVAAQQKSPARFQYLSEAEQEKNRASKKQADTIFTNISFARQNLSSTLFLGSVTPPSREDLDSYHRRKIDERKRLVSNKWLENNKLFVQQKPVCGKKGIF